MDEETLRIGRRSVASSVAGDTRTRVQAGDGTAGPRAGGAGPRTPSDLPTPSPEKYVIEGRIGSGGMGTVLLVSDNDLRRQVAMKVMRSDIGLSPVHRLKFLAEAQATSQLEHPGIPPVHDIGISETGEMYFTMKVVRGRTLRQVLHDLFVGRKEVRRDFTTHRLVSILERVCETVHFAHEKGVLHRDLKPENLMLGDYGEVHVMDWGIAKVLGSEEEEPLEAPVETVESSTVESTLDGALKGTIPYMSPEQAGGRVSALDRRSDVYALGCILYEILTLHPAFEGEDVLRRVREGEFPAVEVRNPKRPVPEALAQLVRRSMALDPEARPGSAEEFRLELRSWLDGTSERNRRTREADALAQRGREALRKWERLRKQLQQAVEAEAAASQALRPWMPVEALGPRFEAGALVAEIRRNMVLTLADALHLLNGALMAEEGHAAARGVLAEHWANELREAERRGQADAAAYALSMVRRYDGGAMEEFLRGDGFLRISSVPEGATVRLRRFEDRSGILVPGPEETLGTTHLGPRSLPMGSYLLLLAAPGCAEARYPVRIDRQRSWNGEVRLRRPEEIGEDFVLVPGGPFLFGSGQETRSVEIPDFVIGRHPVTFGEYGEFLAALEAELGEAEVRKRVPGTPSDGALMRKGGDGRWTPVPGVCEGPLRDLLLRTRGEGFESRIPVMAVTYDDAVAYCGWRARVTGLPWRLPTEEEREKAARGVDGRVYPWGSLDHPALARCRNAREEPAQPEPVGGFPLATSVYGMEGASGNMWEWTASWFDGRGMVRAIRGGAWDSPLHSTACAFRHFLEPDHRAVTVGFRCARSL